MTIWAILWWFLSLVAVFMFFMFVVLRIVKHYVHIPTPGFATQLIDNPARRRLVQRPDEVAERMRLEPGMVVVEIGPGKGSYTITVAERALPGGRVYAVDIQGSVVDRLKERIEREGITNAFPRIDDAYNLSFGDGSVDRVLAIACLPEIPDPVRALREFHRILRPEGMLCLSELLPDPDYPRRSTEVGWAEEAGFELSEEFGNWFVYHLNFRKRPV